MFMSKSTIVAVCGKRQGALTLSVQQSMGGGRMGVRARGRFGMRVRVRLRVRQGADLGLWLG